MSQSEERAIEKIDEQVDVRVEEPLRLVHHHPGYLRIQASVLIDSEGDDSVAKAAQDAAEAVPGVCSWRHNPATGSVVIEYDPGTLEADDLLKHIAKSLGLKGVVISTSRQVGRNDLVNVVLDTVQDLDQVVGQLTGGRADLRELVPAALAATSVVSFMLNENRGSRMPTWDSALYHSYRIFMHWHRDEVRTREKVARKKEENSAENSELVL